MMTSQTPNGVVQEYVFKLSNDLEENLREYTKLINGVQEMKDEIKEKKKQIVVSKKQILGVKAKIEILQGIINRGHSAFSN